MLPAHSEQRTIPYLDEHFGVKLAATEGATHPTSVITPPTRPAPPGYALKIDRMTASIIWNVSQEATGVAADYATFINTYIFRPRTAQYPYTNEGYGADAPVPANRARGDMRYTAPTAARLGTTMPASFPAQVLYQKAYQQNTIATGVEGKTTVNIYTQTQDSLEIPGGLLLPAGDAIAALFIINVDSAGITGGSEGFGMRVAFSGTQIKVDR